MADSSQAPPGGEPPATVPDAALDEARALVAGAETELDAIEQAIKRLEHGTYSTCEVCESPIEPERLSAEPTGRRCAAHDASGRSGSSPVG